MQGPSGWAGVQAWPNRGHSLGRSTPLSTSPQRQAEGAGGVSRRQTSGKRRRASYRA